MKRKNSFIFVGVLLLVGVTFFFWYIYQNAERFSIAMETIPDGVSVGEVVDLQFSFWDREADAPPVLLVDRERIVHVVIVGKDFNEFLHIHPEDVGPVTADMLEKGLFTVRFAPPKGGEYIVAVDAKTMAGHIAQQFKLFVSGAPVMISPMADFSRQGVFGSYDVLLSAPAEVNVGEDVMLSYTIQKNGKPITDLTPYLGAPMHLAVVHNSFKDFFHTHAQITDSDASHGGDHDIHGVLPESFGPGLEARMAFSQKGLYHIFGELSRGGEKILTHFQIEVK